VVLNVKGQTEMEASLTYADDAKAKRSKEALDGGVATAKLFLPILTAAGPKGAGGGTALPVEKIGKQIEEAVNSATIEQRGARVVVTAKLSTDLLHLSAMGGLMGAMDMGDFLRDALRGAAPGAGVGLGGGARDRAGNEEIHQDNLKKLGL